MSTSFSVREGDAPQAWSFGASLPAAAYHASHSVGMFPPGWTATPVSFLPSLQPPTRQEETATPAQPAATVAATGKSKKREKQTTPPPECAATHRPSAPPAEECKPSKRSAPRVDAVPRPNELLDPQSVAEWVAGQHGVQCTLAAPNLGEDLVSCDNGNVAIPAKQVPTTANDMDAVTVIGAVDTKNAGRWLWVSFRSKVWIVPPPLHPVEDAASLDGSLVKYAIYRPPNAPKATLALCYYNTLTPAEVAADAEVVTEAAKPSLRKGTSNFGNRPADVKLGGVCCDVPGACIKAIIETITKISIAFVEVFSAAHSGRCCLWLNDTSEADVLVQRLRGRIWMAPACHGYAVVAVGTAAQAWLCDYLTKLREAGLTRVPFPRHLVTAEKWRLL